MPELVAYCYWVVRGAASVPDKATKKGARKRIGSLHKSLCEKYVKMLYKLIK